LLKIIKMYLGHDMICIYNVRIYEYNAYYISSHVYIHDMSIFLVNLSEMINDTSPLPRFMPLDQVATS